MHPFIVKLMYIWYVLRNKDLVSSKTKYFLPGSLFGTANYATKLINYNPGESMCVSKFC